MNARRTLRSLLCAATLVTAGVAPHGAAAKPPKASTEALVSEAKAFVAATDAELRRLWVAQSLAEWDKQTNITPETESKAAAAGAEAMTWVTGAIKRARKFNALIGTGALDAATERQLQLLRISGQPAPDDPKASQALADVMTRMDAEYGKGKVCGPGNVVGTAGVCQDLGQLEEVMAQSQDPAVLLAAWSGWHDTVGGILRPLYPSFVTLANQGAKAIGFKNVAELWQSGYDMSPGDFRREYARLWEAVRPLYGALHCYTRRKLTERYGEALMPPKGPIPAHLLGNMWAQEWTPLYPLLEPYPGRPQLDTTPALVKQGYDAARMVTLAERFFTSLGMDPLPKSFWDRSMLTQPEGREVVCHASAWDPGYNNDLRIKMCIKPTHSDLITIHHELGHDYYFHHYYEAPMLFQQGANDGFHEAIGDTLALSVTPKYLKDVGLLDAIPTESEGAINQLMYQALDKVAFLPWGLLVDEWRWDVFSGKVGPSQYNARWWALRRELQGVSAPNDRSGKALFDPGAKYHVASNTPYARYFLATILQFQFHRALCRAAGHTGPLHECSIYGNPVAGTLMKTMLAMGASRPWQEALAAVTGGEREMDATALLDYFAPLKTWLDGQNKGQRCGW